MTEQEFDSQGLSTEVFGQLSPVQESDLKSFGLEIFRVLNLHPKKDEDVEMVREVLEDCVLRGLAQMHKVWLSPNEEISPVFQAGLAQRERLAEQAKAVIEGSTLEASGSEYQEWFLSHEERNKLRRATAFSLDLNQVEEITRDYEKKFETVKRLNVALFTKSSLVVKVRALKADLAGELPSILDLDSRLFANLILSMALYQKADVDIEPKDVSALKDLWNDPDLKRRSHERLIKEVVKLSQNLNLDQETVEQYTKMVISRIDVLLEKEITVQSLLNSQFFAFTSKAIEEEQEVEESVEGEIFFSKDQVEKAKNKFKEYLNKQREYSTAVNKPEMDQISLAEMGEAIAQVTGSINDPLELLYLLRDSYLFEADKADLKVGLHTDYLMKDLDELVPLETYIRALRLIWANSLKVSETQEELTDFKATKASNFLKRHLAERVIEELTIDDGKMIDNLAHLPAPVVADLLGSLRQEYLTDGQIEAVGDLDDKIWAKLILEMDAEYDSMEDQVVFSMGGSLEAYFEMLPPEKRKAIAKELKQDISF